MRPRSSTARNVARRCGGTRSRSKSDGSTGANVSRRMACATTAVNGSRSAPRSGPSGSSAEIFAAHSAAGTTWRRSTFGSVRSSAVMSSSRRPGTCQSNPSALHAGEQHEGHDHGHAVVVGAGLEAVRERVGLVGLPPAVGESVAALVVGLGAEQVGARHREEVGSSTMLAAPPALERSRVRDIRRHPRLVERHDGLVAREDVATTRALLDLAELAAQGAVRPHEPEQPAVEAARVPVLLDERVPDEELARERLVDPAELDAPLRHDRHAEQRDLLVGDGRALPTLPPRLAEGALRQRSGELLGPRGIDGARSCGRRAGSSRRARRS